MQKGRSRALVTGASMGLGRAIARELAARGRGLLLVALPGSGLPELGASIARERGLPVDWLEADLTEERSIDRVAALVRDEGLEIELLVNNAGIGGVGPFMELPLRHHEDTINLNILALVRLTRLVITEAAGRYRPRILNVASLGAFYPMPTLAVYSATKSFVLDFSLALRAELEGEADLSVLCPNAIRTTDAVGGYVDRFGLLSRLSCMTPEAVARAALDGLERGRAVIVPGAFNRALGAVARLAPRALVTRAIRHFWGGFAETPRRSEPRGARP
jgi:uncharacterized protein